MRCSAIAPAWVREGAAIYFAGRAKPVPEGRAVPPSRPEPRASCPRGQRAAAAGVGRRAEQTRTRGRGRASRARLPRAGAGGTSGESEPLTSVLMPSGRTPLRQLTSGMRQRLAFQRVSVDRMQWDNRRRRPRSAARSGTRSCRYAKPAGRSRASNARSRHRAATSDERALLGMAEQIRFADSCPMISATSCTVPSSAVTIIPSHSRRCFQHDERQEVLRSDGAPELAVEHELERAGR